MLRESDDRYVAKNLNVTIGDSIKSFVLYDDEHPNNPDPKKTIQIEGGAYIFKNSNNPSFQMTNDGTAKRTS